jgi:hypothetical protein
MRQYFFCPASRDALHRYILSCPTCGLARPRNHKPYGKLRPVPMPSQPLEVICLDFITGLPESQGFNAILCATDKFSKAIRLIPGREDWTASDWADAYFDQVVSDWGLPEAFISDRDPKFHGIWMAVFTRCGVRLRMTTAYHPNADGQSERSNAIIEIMLRCLLVGKYEAAWAPLLADVVRIYNSLPATTTGLSPFQILYGVPPRLLPATRTDIPMLDHRFDIRHDVRDAIDLAQARMSIIYDNHHKPPSFEGQVYVKLVRHPGVPGYRLPTSSKLSPIHMGPYPILEKISDLAYRLDLPASLRINPVISVIHLEQAPLDPYLRRIPTPPPVLVDGEEQYEIEKIIEQRAEQCLVKWRYRDETTWEPLANIREDAPDVLRKFQQSARALRAGRR